jgi:hypothetical protein
VEGDIEPASAEDITRVWEDLWGLPIVTAKREYLPPDVEGLVWRARDGQALGLVTWAVDGARAEIVSLNALGPHRPHLGSDAVLTGSPSADRARKCGASCFRRWKRGCYNREREDLR